MRILIDIGHPAHVNFFSQTANLLKNQGHHVKITVLNRGMLPVIAKDVFSGFDINVINRHRGNKWSVIVEANICKFFTLFRKCLNFQPDIGLSAGSFVLGAVLKILGKPNIQFDDDPERMINVCLEKITSTLLFFPLFYDRANGKVGKYNAMKEWSYLSSRYFSPDIHVLTSYEIKKGEYVFIREVSTGTLNYSRQSDNIIASVAKSFPTEMQVVLSLEDKETASVYPNHWILLKEPVNDIHSLIYFSKLVISSGDSMAREGAMLGIPSIYCGIREMAANMVLKEKGMLLHLSIQEVPKTVTDIINGTLHFHDQVTFRSNLEKEWEDVPEFISSRISDLKKDKL